MNPFSDVKCFIVDMDGTFYLGDELLPGAREFANAVQKAGKQFFFFTNNSSHSEEECIQKLNRLGYPAKKGDVIISSHVAADFIKRNRPGKTVYLLGNQNLTNDFIKAGIPLTQTDPDIVVLGFDTTLTYEKITKTAVFLANGAEYIATHPDVNCPLKNGFMTDVGSFIKMFEASAGRTPDLIMGKPYAFTVDYVTNRLKIKREEICFVGDRLETDIAIGVNNGLLSALVFTGVTTRKQYENSPIKAAAAFDNIGELGEMLLKEQ